MPNYELHKKICDDILSYPLEQKEYSEEWCGLYVDGTSKLTFEQANPAFHSFRLYGKKKYPIILFVSLFNDKTELDKILSKYDNVIVWSIKPLESPEEYNEWMFNICFKLIWEKFEKIYTFQEDGFLIKEGFEDFFDEGKFDYIGAPWNVDHELISPYINCPKLRVGNGGCSLRLRSKMLECIKLIQVTYSGQHQVFKGIKIGGEIKQNNSWLAEDILFCTTGFGNNIFKPVAYNEARKFSHEPIDSKLYFDKENLERPLAWHKCDF